jgi:hypothetical protein
LRASTFVLITMPMELGLLALVQCGIHAAGGHLPAAGGVGR